MTVISSLGSLRLDIFLLSVLCGFTVFLKHLLAELLSVVSETVGASFFADELEDMLTLFAFDFEDFKRDAGRCCIALSLIFEEQFKKFVVQVEVWLLSLADLVVELPDIVIDSWLLHAGATQEDLLDPEEEVSSSGILAVQEEAARNLRARVRVEAELLDIWITFLLLSKRSENILHIAAELGVSSYRFPSRMVLLHVN